MIIEKILQLKEKYIIKKISLWEKERPILLAQQNLKQDKEKIKNRFKEEKRKITTTKFLMFFLFTSCSIIQIFTLFVTIKSMNMGIYDFSALQMLITAVVGEVVAFAVYAIKSLKENTIGGIVYESAMLEQKQNLLPKEDTSEVQG